MIKYQKKLSMEKSMAKLADGDVEVRKLAVNSLEGIKNEKIIESLIKSMNDENIHVKHKAAENLGKMGDLVVDRLIEVVNKEEGEYKKFASFALKTTGSEKAIDYFSQSINDENFGVRKIALRALGELKAIDKIDDIIEIMRLEEDWGVRLAAVRTLEDMGVKKAINPIKKARREEKDKHFKKAADKAIKKIEKVIKKNNTCKIKQQ